MGVENCPRSQTNPVCVSSCSCSLRAAGSCGTQDTQTSAQSPPLTSTSCLFCCTVCPLRFFEAEAGAASCTRCPHGAYCPGGERVPNPISRGRAIPCGTGLITRNTGARAQSDCVAPKGWAMTRPTEATPCSPSEYSPQFNRLSRCISCPSGLQEPPDSNLTAGDRDSRRAVCSEYLWLEAAGKAAAAATASFPTQRVGSDRPE